MLLNCGVREDPWTARRSNQSILKEINPEYSLEGLMLKLKLQCFGPLMGRVNSLQKTLKLGKIEGRRRGWQRTRCLNGITESIDMSLSKLWSWWWTRKLGVLQSMWSQRVRHNWVTELKWTETQRIVKSSKGETTSDIQGKPHTLNSWSFSRNSAGQKGMVGYI